jgi:8-oxo-dGTP pyrophosphatase MutT (NUDIX family)
MSHIHTEPNQHDATASAFIVRVDGPQPRILLHRHQVLGKYMQFGGHVELDEHPWTAVAREIREESGYDFGQLHVLVPAQRIQHVPKPSLLLPLPLCVMTEVYGDGSLQHFHDDLMWLFTAASSPKHEVSADESTDMMLCTRGELIARASDILDDVYELALYIFDTGLSSLQAIPALPLER